MESTILELYELDPSMTDSDVLKALKSLRRILVGEDTVKDYTILPWTLFNVVRVVAAEKKWSDRAMVNCVDRLMESVENHSFGKNSQDYLEFLSAWLSS
ncbi:MAG: hypothetical protein AB1793_04610 [Candidatus Thermoplasmatota archaeon]